MAYGKKYFGKNLGGIGIISFYRYYDIIPILYNIVISVIPQLMPLISLIVTREIKVPLS